MVLIGTAITEVARTLGPYAGPLTTSTTATTTTSVTCSSLVESEWPASRFGRAYLRILDGPLTGQQRQITGQGLDRTNGVLTLSRAFSSTVGTGIRFDISFRVPFEQHADRPGVLDAILEACREITFVDRLPVSATTGARTYQLAQTSYPWFDDERTLLDVYEPLASGETVALRSTVPRPDFRMDFESIYLDFEDARWETGETFFLEVRRPATSRVLRTASAYAALTGTAVTSVTLLTTGYYTGTAPTVSFSGGGGTGATATAVVTNSTVASVTVTATGTGYTTPPLVAFSAGDWADATDEIFSATGWGLADQIRPRLSTLIPVARYRAYLGLLESGLTVPEGWQERADRWKLLSDQALARLTQRADRENAPRLSPTAIGGGAYSRWGWTR